MSERDILRQLHPLMAGFVFAIGLCIGSFLNVCIWRLPRGESLLHPGSHCPKCGHPIRPWENIPVLSWLALRAKCSQCSLPISGRYPLVEFVTGVLCLAVWFRVYHLGLGVRPTLWLLPGYLFLVAALLAISFTDVEHLVIPNPITYSGMVFALVLAVVAPEAHPISRVGSTGPLLQPIVSVWVGDWLAVLCPWLNIPSRSFSALDSLVGMGMGFSLLYTMLHLGRLLWGRERVRIDEPTILVANEQGMSFGGEPVVPWVQLLPAPRQQIEVSAQEITIHSGNGETELAAPAQAEAGGGGSVTRVEFSDRGMTVAGESRTWEQATLVEVRSAAWVVPREVLGFGDLKLLAMIGAFLGPDACIFILMLASLVGTLVGIAALALKRTRNGGMIPFGPILAVSACLWIFAGPELLRWYCSLWTKWHLG